MRKIVVSPFLHRLAALACFSLCVATFVADAAMNPSDGQLYLPISASELSGLTKFDKKLPTPGKLKDTERATNRDIDKKTHLPLNPLPGAVLPHPVTSDLKWDPSALSE